MIGLLVILVLLFLLFCGLLWAGSGKTVHEAQGSGIIEAIPAALEDEPSLPTGLLVILSYSLAYGLGPQRCRRAPADAAMVYDRLDHVIETIAASEADIALLQEVDFASARTHDIDQLYYIASALGWGYAARALTWECRYLPYPCWPWGQPTGRLQAGMGVISRYTLVQNVRQRLPQAHPYPLLSWRFAPQHTVQMVDVQCGRHSLRLLNVHLEARRVAGRQRQMRALVRFARNVHTTTSVLMGAFNCGVSSLAAVGDHEQNISVHSTMALIIHELQDRFRMVPTSAGTSPSVAARYHLDHALVGSGLSPLETRLIPVDASVSDRLPLVLYLRWTLPLMSSGPC